MKCNEELVQMLRDTPHFMVFGFLPGHTITNTDVIRDIKIPEETVSKE